MNAEETLEAVRGRILMLTQRDVAKAHGPQFTDALLEVLRWLDGHPMDPELMASIRQAKHVRGHWVTPG